MDMADFRKLLAAALLVGGLQAVPARAAEPALVIPAPASDEAQSGAKSETAVIAGGCFWGIQAVYQHTDGVLQAVSGYAGGTKESADYRTVSSGRTGHAESVEITFDPSKISYGKILQIFFSVAHNPTELNMQGPDVGPQYRSDIFYATPEQKRVAEAYVKQLDATGIYKRPIVTRVDALDGFYRAEDYHQDYAHNNPMQPYIMFNDAPKVVNLKKIFSDVYREQPVLVAAAAKTKG